jgi:hypothetical protein
MLMRNLVAERQSATFFFHLSRVGRRPRPPPRGSGARPPFPWKAGGRVCREKRRRARRLVRQLVHAASHLVDDDGNVAVVGHSTRRQPLHVAQRLLAALHRGVARGQTTFDGLVDRGAGPSAVRLDSRREAPVLGDGRDVLDAAPVPRARGAHVVALGLVLDGGVHGGRRTPLDQGAVQRHVVVVLGLDGDRVHAATVDGAVAVLGRRLVRTSHLSKSLHGVSVGGGHIAPKHTSER